MHLVDGEKLPMTVDGGVLFMCVPSGLKFCLFSSKQECGEPLQVAFFNVVKPLRTSRYPHARRDNLKSHGSGPRGPRLPAYTVARDSDMSRRCIIATLLGKLAGYIVVGQRSDDDAPREGGMRQYLVPAPDHRFRWLGVLPPNRTTEDAWIGLEVGWR